MLRKCTDEDISDEECEKIIDPFYDNYQSFVEEYIVPEVVAFYIASSFYKNAMWEATFKQHFILLVHSIKMLCGKLHLNSILILHPICLILFVRTIRKLKPKLLNYLKLSIL